jgi:uracil-DNA glycosylase
LSDSLAHLREEVVACRKCPRLVRYRESVARERKREFREVDYWGRPVPGFGDPNARLVLIGLAPGAHGSNRTGRVFTGDRSARFLVGSLYAAGFASQPTSTERGDGLRYRDAYVTAAVRCVPPDNRPSASEWEACRPYLERELRLLTNARAYLALGGFAWESARDALARVYGAPLERTPFAHGACLPIGPGRPLLWGSYHPSPQNTNTGRLTEAMFLDLLARIRAGWGGAPSVGRGRGGTRAAPGGGPWPSSN